MSLVNKARQKIGSAIAGKPFQASGNESFAYDAMKQAGLQVITTERVYNRQSEEKSFTKLFDLKPPENLTPEKRFEWYVNLLNLIWSNYKSYQMAWFRSGSEPGFAQMVTAIEGMREYTDMAIERNRHRLEHYNKGITEAEKDKDKNQAIINKLESRKEQLVRNFYISWLVMLMFKYIRAQGNLSWKREDVNPPITLAIQTVQPIQQSYPSTTNEHPKAYTPPTQSQNWGQPINDEKETEGEPQRQN